MPQWQLRVWYYSNMTTLAQKGFFKVSVCVCVRVLYLLWWRTSGCCLYHPLSRCLWNKRVEGMCVKINMEWAAVNDGGKTNNRTACLKNVCVCVCVSVGERVSCLHPCAHKTRTVSTFRINQLPLFSSWHIQQTNTTLPTTKHTTELFKSEIYTLVCYIPNKAD